MYVYVYVLMQVSMYVCMCVCMYVSMYISMLVRRYWVRISVPAPTKNGFLKSKETGITPLTLSFLSIPSTQDSVLEPLGDVNTQIRVAHEVAAAISSRLSECSLSSDAKYSK